MLLDVRPALRRAQRVVARVVQNLAPRGLALKLARLHVDGVGVHALVRGEVFRAVVLADGVNAPVLAVEEERNIPIILRGHIRIVHGDAGEELVAHVGGVGILHARAQKQRGKVRHDAVAEHVVIEIPAVPAAEFERERFLFAHAAARAAVHADAAVDGELAAVLVHGDGRLALPLLAPRAFVVGVNALRAGEIVRVGHKTDDGQRAVLAQEVRPCRRFARQRVRREARGADDRRFRDRDGRGIGRSVRRRVAAVERIVHVLAGDRQRKALGVVVHARGDIDRGLCRHHAVPRAVVRTAAALRKIEIPVLPV